MQKSYLIINRIRNFAPIKTLHADEQKANPP